MADFSGDDVVERHMDRLGREPLLQTIRDAAGYQNADLDRVLKEYGERIRPSLNGALKLAAKSRHHGVSSSLSGLMGSPARSE